MSGEFQDGRSRVIADAMERRRRAEAEALAELARLVEGSEAAFPARPREPRTATQDKRRA